MLNEWMPVTDRLPDDDITVLLAFSDREVWPGYRDGDTWRSAEGMPIEAARVTHWMHMPEAPGGGEPA